MEGIGRILYAVTLPFLAHSHFNASLKLSRMLATRGVTVICVTLPSNLEMLRSRVQGWGDLPLHFHDLSVRESPLPPGRQNVNNISGDELPMIFDLIHKMREPLECLMAELTGREYYESRGLPSPDRLILIYDLFMGWSAPVANKFGVQSFMFGPGSAHAWLCLEALFRDMAEPPLLPEVADAVGSWSLPDFVMAELRQHLEFTRKADGLLLNTFRELEPKFVRHLEDGSGGGKPFWAVGPVVELPARDKIQTPRDAEIVEWLDRQMPGSVVYVAFGSESYISPSQVKELAVGLEESGQPFLWVLRPPGSTLGDNLTPSADDWKADALPEGYEQRLEGRCLIETRWAPQAAILAHEATGAFITHCGWNSVLESVVAGVPMIPLPLHSEQPINAVLLAKEVKLAVEMKISDGVAKRDEVKRAVRALMAEEEMKRRLKDVSVVALAAVSEEGGAVWKNVESFIQHWSLSPK